MSVNREAIYDTRPWIKFGEDNLRFTQKGKDLYVIALELPDAGEKLNISSLGKNENVGKVSQVTLLGYDGKVEWQQNDSELSIAVPTALPCKHAYSFRVIFEGIAACAETQL